MPVSSPTPIKWSSNFFQEDANSSVGTSVDKEKSRTCWHQNWYQGDYDCHIQEGSWDLPSFDPDTPPNFEGRVVPYLQANNPASMSSPDDISRLNSVGIPDDWPNEYNSDGCNLRNLLEWPVLSTEAISPAPSYSHFDAPKYTSSPEFSLVTGCSLSLSNFSPHPIDSDDVLETSDSTVWDFSIPPNPTLQAQNSTTARFNPVKDSSKMLENYSVPSQPRPAKQKKPLSEVEEAFSKFVPLLSTVTAHNVSEFLTECMKEYHRYVSLDDLYNLLFGDISDSALASSAEGLSIQKHESFGSKFNGIDFCRLIIDTFRGPHDSQTLEKRSSQVYLVPIVNFPEFLRSFLGIKILCILVLRDQDKDVLSSGCPAFAKSSLYKGYYIICQKLFQKYSSCLCRGIKDIIVSPAKLGRLTNLLYPNLAQKRIGRRGESKPHYLGLNWNYDIVDKNMLGMLDLEIPHLEDYFNTIKAKRELNVSCLGHAMS